MMEIADLLEKRSDISGLKDNMGVRLGTTNIVFISLRPRSPSPYGLPSPCVLVKYQYIDKA